jgi:hypothetical protein
MIRKTLLLLSIWVAGNAQAECTKWEYLRLKDANKAELSDLYCASVSQAIIAHKGAKYRSENGLYLQAADKMKEQQICMEQVEEAEAMLKKKFKAKPTSSCASRYQKEGNRSPRREIAGVKADVAKC